MDEGVSGTRRSRAHLPESTRKQQWRTAEEAAILRLRHLHRRAGKAKLQVLLVAEGIDLSESNIGRILASLTKRGLLIEPPNGIRTWRAKRSRPYVIRVPEDKRKPTEPGALVQVDTVHIHPPAEPQRRVRRRAVLGVRSQATAGTAAAFLDEVVMQMPFSVQSIQVDGGSESSWRSLSRHVSSVGLPCMSFHRGARNSMGGWSG